MLLQLEEQVDWQLFTQGRLDGVKLESGLMPQVVAQDSWQALKLPPVQFNMYERIAFSLVVSFFLVQKGKNKSDKKTSECKILIPPFFMINFNRQDVLL